MPLRFRLHGLAETFVDTICCPGCGFQSEDEEDEAFSMEHTKVTYDGIIVVLECPECSHLFVPDDQRMGIIDASKLRDAVERDSDLTGQPILQTLEAVRLDVERLNEVRDDKVQ